MQAELPKTAGRRPAIVHWSLRAALAFIDEGAAAVRPCGAAQTRPGRPGTGYRYRESQLATARLVVMLRRLDMPLVQVAEIVSAPGPVGAERLAS